MKTKDVRNEIEQEVAQEVVESIVGPAEVSDEVLRSVTGGCGKATTKVTSCVPPGAHCP